ncbi:MAG: cation-transporting P-type ATPase [Oscillospiraceae bacterium]|nr:cation-transporting P-type ATPase [Oscillospiraceae bacterium]
MASMDYRQSAADIAAELGSDIEKGLTIEMAHERIHSRGRNVIRAAKVKSTFAGVRGHLLSVMNIVLLLMAVIHIVYDGRSGIPVSVCFVLCACVNAAVGYISFKRSNSAAAAAEAAQNQSVRVLRSGTVKTALATLLAQGDVCFLEKGQTVPADAKIIECDSLTVDEGIINGDGSLVTKTHSAGIEDESVTVLYMGTKIITGSAKVIVTGVGNQTQLGTAMGLLMGSGEKSSAFAGRIVMIGNLCGAAAAVMWAVALIFRLVGGYGAVSAFDNSIAAAITALPVSLSAILLITMSFDIFRLKKLGIDVASTSALEAMGASTVLCTGKRGVVTELGFGSTELHPGKGFDENDLRLLAAMCTTAEIDSDGARGDVMQVALIEDALAHGFSAEEIRSAFPQEKILDERSSKRIMTTVHKTDGGYRIICKGSADAVLSCCSKIYDSGERPLDPQKDLAEIIGESQAMSAGALTVIGVAYKDVLELSDKFESDLTFAGLVGLSNPVRKDTAQSIKTLNNMGVKLCVITNENLTSASVLAEKIGIGKDGVGRGSTAEPESLSRINKNMILADTPPSMKTEIIAGINSRRENVVAAGRSSKDIDAMTKGEVSVATDAGAAVCISASDVHVSGSGLGRIAAAIMECKRTFINNSHIICFLLACNVAEMVCAVVSLVMGYSIPFTPSSILWLNTVIAAIGSAAIWREPYHRRLTAGGRRLNSMRKGRLAPSILMGAAVRGILMGGAATLLYVLSAGSIGVADRRSAVFISLCSAITFMAQSCRSAEPIYKRVTKNPVAVVSFVLAALIIALTLTLPSLTAVLSLSALDADSLGAAIGVGVVPALLIEIYKLLKKR